MDTKVRWWWQGHKKDDNHAPTNTSTSHLESKNAFKTGSFSYPPTRSFKRARTTAGDGKNATPLGATSAAVADGNCVRTV
jgi:hypothetical protein